MKTSLNCRIETTDEWSSALTSALAVVGEAHTWAITKRDANSLPKRFFSPGDFKERKKGSEYDVSSWERLTFSFFIWEAVNNEGQPLGHDLLVLQLTLHRSKMNPMTRKYGFDKEGNFVQIW